ncbi:MAG TPA: efflux RND transporter periplasmic adaptor subunit [Longimicrobiaceae bacterium]|nr:efflux RND transporter periplasmic adaptor subunit [Longimicrobiaceae bacterium]
MSKRTRLVLYTFGFVAVVGGGTAVATGRGGHEDAAAPSVTVARTDVTDKALAVGTIEPEVSISVKSQVSGVVSRAYAEAGDYVEAGAPLLEIHPDPTPLERVESGRDVQMKELALAGKKRELERTKALAQRGLIPAQELDSAQRAYDEAALQLKTAKEKVQLMESGRIRGTEVESMVRAPISGYVLERTVEQGDPVVPLTSYQEGTVLMTMADMSKLLFKGSVDEIDVGRLREGMPVTIKIGALPDAKVTGRVSRISLQAKEEDNAVRFPVEIALDPVTGVTLRAGLSANAEVIVNSRNDVLTVPERVVTYEKDGSAWVTVQRADGTTEKRTIETGLSDALQVEVVSGLKEGERVLEKPVKSID